MLLALRQTRHFLEQTGDLAPNVAIMKPSSSNPMTGEETLL